MDGTASYSLVSLLHQQENTLVECRFRMRFYLRLERLMTLGPKLDWCPWRFANLKMPPFTLLLQPAVQARQAEVEQRHDLSLFYSFFLNGCYRSLSYLYRMCHPYIMPPIRSLSMGYTVEPKAWTELAPEVRDGGQGASLFNHTNDVAEPIPAAEAFRHLLVRQTFALGGLSRTFDYSAKRSPSPNAVFLIPHGQNLLETLCYCLDPNNYAHYEHDVPFWERDTVYDVAYLEKTKEEAVMGCVQAYTWMSRAVKLEPLETEVGVYVKDIYFASGLAPKFEVAQYYDPMVGSFIAASGTYKGQAVFTKFRAGRRFWRDFHSLFTQQQDKEAPRVVGMSIKLASKFRREVSLGVYGLSNGTQEAKIDFARQEHYRLPEAVVADRTEDVYATLEELLAQAEGLEKRLFAATRKLAEGLLSHGGRSPDPADVTNLVKTFPVATSYWTTLDRAFGKLLQELTANFKPSDAERFWAQELLNASDRAWELARTAAGDDAFALRAVYSAEGGLRAAQKPFRTQVKEAA